MEEINKKIKIININNLSHITYEPSSFRDSSSRIFYRDGVVFRGIDFEYAKSYTQLITSGLYAKLIEERLLIPHEETSEICSPTKDKCYKCIKPQQIPFISYPYEWTFSQLKDAAITTLKINAIALKYGMVLKDASAYNIQFLNGFPILIDTCSFECYTEGIPWKAYRQFCRHFLAPLCLAAYTDIRINKLIACHIDGIPLDFTARVLPFKSRFNLGIYAHIHLNAHYTKKTLSTKSGEVHVSQRQLDKIIWYLSETITKLKWEMPKTTWSNYYNENNYAEEGIAEKKIAVLELAEYCVGLKLIWDIGANSGVFSRLISDFGTHVVSMDNDESAIEENYICTKRYGVQNILPLHIDFSNPTPAIGWANVERMSLIDRGPADLILALALIHHLVITQNIKWDMIVELFSKLCKYLIIEFMPVDDSMVQRLLIQRGEMSTEYSQIRFESSFSLLFNLVSKRVINNNKRIVYLYERKNEN